MKFSSRPNLSQEAIREFLAETQESIEQVEADLVQLESNPQGSDASDAIVSRMFRMLHSMKGTCGFLGYPKVEELAHVGENLLGRIREGVLAVDATVVTALLSVVDAIREVLDHIEAENNEGDQDYARLTQQLSQICSASQVPDSVDLSGSESTPDAPRVEEDDPSHDREPHSDSSSIKADEPQFVERTVQMQRMDSGLKESQSVSESPQDQASSQWHSSNEGPPSTSRREDSAVDRTSDSSLRIDVSLLDEMMMLAGELVLTRNQILQDKSLERNGRLPIAFRQLNSITSELQSCIMKSRMRPIATIWKQMPRLVRDVALGAFKQVRLEMAGAETELDKTIIEAIRDPLTHVLRNSVDHGIELPELRVALGKPAEGRVWMRAYHAGGQINIEIEDDGAGIDVQAIRRKALEHNLIAPSQAEQMSDAAILGLIFQPGFSTAATVTKLSGRGVGLDVVKSNIEKLGGAIHVQSVLREGTTITLRIPLTLAIVQAVVVETTDQTYVVPQSRIVELMHLRGADARAVLDASDGVPNFRYRGRLLPILHLDELLGLQPSEASSLSQEVRLVVVNVQDRHYGLVVERIIDNQEVVIKPLWQPLRSIPIYAGATQLANGKVALILDPIGLAKRAGLVSERHEVALDKHEDESAPENSERILLASLPNGERIAISANGLTRIEEVTRSQIRQLHGQDMMEYDGDIVRVINLATLLGESPRPNNSGENEAQPRDELEATHVALFDADDETVGLVVGPVVDIVEHGLDVRGKATRPHVQFTTIIEDHFVEFLDVDKIIASA